MTEALSMVKALFDAGIASFAQVLRADGWIPKNLVPMHDTVLTEACRRPRRLAMLDA